MLYFVMFTVLFCLTVKGYSGKKFSTFVRSVSDTYVFNLLRMIFCIAIGFVMVFSEKTDSPLLPDGKMIAICALSGFSSVLFLVFWMLAIRVNSMVSVDVGLTLGSLVPSVLCLILFREKFSLLKMIGFAAILISAFILSGGKTVNKSRKRSGILLLAVAAIGDGMSGFAQQLYKQYYTESGSRFGNVSYPKSVFHLYTYVFAAIMLFAFLVGYRIVIRRKADAYAGSTAKNKPKSLSAAAVMHVFVMSVCLFASNYLQTVATNDYGLSSQIMYPIIKGGCLVTVNFVAMMFFGEKITRRSIIGSLVAVAGIVIMSII